MKTANSVQCLENINALIIIGGDGSLTGARIFAEEYDVTCIGLPGTIDNELYCTDVYKRQPLHMDDFHSLYGRYPDVSVCDAGYGSEENYLYAFRPVSYTHLCPSATELREWGA